MTPAQLATLKAAILADSVLGPLAASSSFYEISLFYNSPSTTDVWRTDARTSEIFDAITWANYTPVDAPDATALFTNRLLSIQTKQMNRQDLLGRRDTIDASKANIRNGLRDCVIQLPSGPGGTMLSAGGASGAAVLNACVRKANQIEKLLASAPVSTGTVSAGVMGYEGEITIGDIIEALK